MIDIFRSRIAIGLDKTMCVEKDIGMANDSYTNEELIRFLLQQSSMLHSHEVVIPPELHKSISSCLEEGRNLLFRDKASSLLEPTNEELVQYLKGI
jgi:hypothetical protein